MLQSSHEVPREWLSDEASINMALTPYDRVSHS